MRLRLTVEGLGEGCVHELHADGVRDARGPRLLQADTHPASNAIPRRFP
jgi:hypothetical protein